MHKISQKIVDFTGLRRF